MLKVLITSDSRYPVNRKIIKKAVGEVINEAGFGKMDLEVSVAIVGSRKMQTLVKKYMDDGQDHSVLSFGLEELEERGGGGFVNAPSDTLLLGDIILCWPKVVLEAAKADVMVDEKVAELTSHSTLHLLGKHHGD